MASNEPGCFSRAASLLNSQWILIFLSLWWLWLLGFNLRLRLVPYGSTHKAIRLQNYKAMKCLSLEKPYGKALTKWF